MILSNEAQQTLILLSQRRTKDPTCQYWGTWDTNEKEWTCLACGFKMIIEQGQAICGNNEGSPTHKHGLECLAKYNLLILI